MGSGEVQQRGAGESAESHDAYVLQRKSVDPAATAMRALSYSERRLQKVQGVAGNGHETKEEAEEVPTLEQQLDVALQLAAKASYSANTREEKTAVQEARLAFLDSFRKAYGGLPPIRETMPEFAIAINDAVDYGKGAKTILGIFEKERQAHVDRDPRRMPGGNFALGVIAGAVELGEGFFTLANEGRKAAGVGVEETEKQASKRVLGEVAASLMDLSHLAAAILRTEEYKAAMKDDGMSLGYVMGKHYFDIASIVLGAKALGVAKGALKGGQAATTAAKVEGTVAKTLVEGAGNVTSGGVVKGTALVAGAAISAEAALELGESATGTLAKGVVRQIPKALEHTVKHVLKEAPQELSKEAAKTTPHKVAEAGAGATKEHE